MNKHSHRLMDTTTASRTNVSVSTNSRFKIALCQLRVTNDKANNLIRARNMLEEAANQGAKLLVLPEMWLCPYSHEHFEKCGEELNTEESSPTYHMLSKISSSHQITIVGGSIPERRNGQMYNTCCVFGPDGKLKAKHSKLHLFDYYEASGDVSFRESDSFTAGDTPTVAHTDVGCIGIGICHDIRFPELAMLYRAKGANLIIYPAAFNMSTGMALWELETKARQMFVAVCSPSRDSAGSYTIWGHSMLVGPSGEVKAKAEHGEEIVVAEINYAENQLQRELFPLQRQRKEEIYKFLGTKQSKTNFSP